MATAADLAAMTSALIDSGMDERQAQVIGQAIGNCMAGILNNGQTTLTGDIHLDGPISYGDGGLTQGMTCVLRSNLVPGRTGATVTRWGGQPGAETSLGFDFQAWPWMLPAGRYVPAGTKVVVQLLNGDVEGGPFPYVTNAAVCSRPGP